MLHMMNPLNAYHVTNEETHLLKLGHWQTTVSVTL